MVHDDALSAKVAAVNKANAYALEIYPRLRLVFEPLVGQKILKVDGTLLAKVEKLLPEFPCSPGLHAYESSSDYSLRWCVKTMESYQSRQSDCQIASYYEADVYIGTLENGVLTKLYEPPILRTDFTVGEISNLRAAYEKAKEAAREARSALGPFGEYDVR